MDLSFLPAVNATLNGLAGAMLIAGVVLIKRKKINAHRNMMLGAFAVSCIFLVSYVTHYVWRARVMGGAHTPYRGPGPVRVFYYAMLISHILLAMVAPVLAIRLIRLGLRRQDARHRRVAKIAFPLWLYVSVTGVLVYVMLYHFNPKG